MQVSIHLMLLFISKNYDKSGKQTLVSIHLMLLFICITGVSPPISICFNTSHVTLYLFFLPLFYVLIRFNTSHVTLYPFFRGSEDPFRTVSIHLMLLFIGQCDCNGKHMQKFQYISCYSLSHSGDLAEMVKHRFNTSHVTLYQNQ